jgi:diguanylate cyclase (GGDEF)-like protein
MNVLVVDDNETNRKLLRVTLAAEGHKTVERANGLEALESLERSKFDAVISDILMPGMDGYRLCYEIRRNQRFKSIPIIIYSSTYTSPGDEQVALKAGADKFISKPAPKEVLLEALKDLASTPRSPGAEVAAPGMEPDLLRQYSERLVWKLEERNLELEAAWADLVEENEDLHKANEALEKDVSERKRVDEQVKHLAFHDPLTGLPNRLLFNDRLAMALNQARRYQRRVATFFLDLDGFKAINDSLGHSIGDELLRSVAERLRTCLREEDTVARLGGDEFIFLVSSILSAEDAAIVAQKILDKIRPPFHLDGRELFVTASIGVSIYPSDGRDPEALVRSADAAMYQAKEEGRDTYQICTPGMSIQSVERLALENRLRHALAEDKFLLHYQPIVDLRSGRILEVEALLRWQAELGLVPPREFIPVAENSGLIVPISQWVLRSACGQAAGWRSTEESPLGVSINLSARQFQQPDLVGEVSRALEEAGLPAECLDLEITETNAMQDVEHSASVLRRLKDLAVHISLDDFGTGYSSLSYLRRLPIDRIKIDQSFVHNATDDPDDAAIVAAVIAMAHRLKLIVVAEGVETAEQLAFLRDQDCDRMQGYLFSHPLPASELEGLLRGGRELASPLQRLLFSNGSSSAPANG